MAVCISCGRETEPGKIFCPECFAAMAPEEQERQREDLPLAGPGPQEAAAEGRQPSGRASDGTGKPIDVVKASVLTPPGEKRVLKAPAAARVQKVGKGRREKPTREGPTLGDRVKRPAVGAGRGVAATGRALKGAALKSGRWMKGLARQGCAPFQQADLVAWWIGLGASLLLLAAVTLMNFLKFAWMPEQKDAFEAVFSYLKAYDLGPMGYVLIACAVLAAVFHALTLPCARYGWKAPLNPAFLAAVFCVLALVLMPVALTSNEAITSSATARALEPTLKLGYAKKTLLYGSYTALFCLVVTFGAASSILAEEKNVPFWMASLYEWSRERLRGSKLGATAGSREVKKEDGDPGA